MHIVLCVNLIQSHHILGLARQWKIPICNVCARWALFLINFRPQQEIEAKLGDGQTIHSGTWYMCTCIVSKSIGKDDYMLVTTSPLKL